MQNQCFNLALKYTTLETGQRAPNLASWTFCGKKNKFLQNSKNHFYMSLMKETMMYAHKSQKLEFAKKNIFFHFGSQGDPPRDEKNDFKGSPWAPFWKKTIMQTVQTIVKWYSFANTYDTFLVCARHFVAIHDTFLGSLHNFAAIHSKIANAHQKSVMYSSKIMKRTKKSVVHSGKMMKRT